MRILAVDAGSVRVGLALSDELGLLATPLPAHRRTESIKKDTRAIAMLAEERGASEIIVGLPRNMDNTLGEPAEMAQEFADSIGRYTRIPVTMVDERLTTVEAARRLQEAGLDTRKQRGLIDSQAAVVLLEGYLRAREIRETSGEDASETHGN